MDDAAADGTTGTSDEDVTGPGEGEAAAAGNARGPESAGDDARGDATSHRERIDGVIDAMSTVCSEIAAGDRANLERLFALAAATGEGADSTSGKLAALAEAFGMMIVQLEVREYELTQTVEELRESKRQLEHAKAQLDAENRSLRRTVRKLNIEIDHSRKENEVSEIVETDYFRQLQDKARRMRGRAGGEGA